MPTSIKQLVRIFPELVQKKKGLIHLLSYLIVILVLTTVHAVGLRNPVTEHHDFCQTPVAVSSFWMVREDFYEYVTHVSLPPCTAPRELPAFQFLCALVVESTDLSLDQVGRTLSFVFFLITIPVFSGFLRDHDLNEFGCSGGACMFALSPTYIFGHAQ